MIKRNFFHTTILGVAVAAALVVLRTAHGANTDIANEPLSQAASGVQPNVMFILDASGSMDWDYSPDYVDDGQSFFGSGTASCFDSGDDDSGAITGNPDACRVGDPPYMSPDFNRQYYNPAIFYRPGVNADGSEKTNMNAANTSNWTAVSTDPYGQQQVNQLGNSKSTENLVTGYPDRVWCRDDDDNVTDTVNCRANSAYSYPNNEFKYTSDDGRYRFGRPYYYRMQTAQWCSTPTLDAGTCVSGNDVDPSVHVYVAPEYCTDSELTNCAAGAAVTASHTFSGIRWCSDQSTLLNCQRKKVGAFRWPKHLGVTKALTTTIAPAKPATATITITQSAIGERVTNITVGTVSIIAAPVVAGGSSTSALATAVRDAINAYVSTPEDYTATVSGNVVTITAVTPGLDGNGKTIAVETTSTGISSASATITVNATNNNNDAYVYGVEVNLPGGAGWTNVMFTDCTGSYGNDVGTQQWGGNRRIRADRGTNSPDERDSMAAAIAACINQAGNNYSATATSNVVTVRAPLADGDLLNGRGIRVTAGGQNINYGFTNFSGGASNRVTASASNSTSGGADPVTQTVDIVRAGVGFVTRTNIDPVNNSYPKAPGRVDCVGATCTFAEEMTNFANWYAYYRTRMQMMKSAAGRAFVPIDDTYRVGFITIKPFQNPNNTSANVHSSRYLKIDAFNSTHKADWYAKFYAQTPLGGTPLREALARVGRLYAGKFDGINSGIPPADDPMQVSCQPNFAILSSDGYWNGNNGDKLDGSGMDQQDDADVAPYSRRADGVYDGNPSNQTVGLADTALYYYQTDLRPSGSTNPGGVNVSADNVPTTQLDFAPHQHMTTFTLGLGLDGFLTYRSDYQTANAGDFHAIRQGTLDWPDPVGDTPSALDDLWHAAVNGRGVFFSASNPQELARSLTDTLDALKKRVGAGAAAATSNLQPVAGDNFAFTAQYQTQDWIGDLKARTIDLSTGAISFVELWSAQARLNVRQHIQRTLFTFDPKDAYVSTSTDAVGNGMKHFCMAADAGADDWCDDGPGLTDGSGDTLNELLYFDPTQLPQSITINSNPAQAPNWTTANLVNYLRGDKTFEDQGAVGPQDLFRRRSALLGDIINAQPAYVKAAPFDYSDPGYAHFKACTEGTASQLSPAVTCPSAQFEDPSKPRRPTVYIAANDGMLHAIETDVNNDPYYQTKGIDTATTGDDEFSGGNNAGNGEERWAYIPGIVLPDLHKLATLPPFVHRYYVDGSPVVSDICLSKPCAGLNDWRTILVGGLNAGGRGFYALDITNPLKPRAMWEFKVRNPSVTACAADLTDAMGETDDCDLGLSFGNPVITKVKFKIADGPPIVYESRWVVIVSSGLNNTGVEPGGTLRQGDGKGYLYILDAVTGKILRKIATGVGDPGTAGANYADADPSGLAKINNWVDSSLTDNTTLAVYGGDMKGNLWRFDLDGSSANYLQAVKVAELKDQFGTAQPVTTKPELGLISNRRVIFVGTGRFLGNTDKANTSKQTIYAIADDLVNGFTMTDRSTDLVPQTIATDANDSTIRTVATPATVNWSNPAVRGWYVDLPDKGERVSVDPQLQLGTLVVPSNVPSNDTCVAGGTAWINTFDFKTGSFVAGATGSAVSQKVTGSVVVGINVIQLPGGKVVTVVTTADNQQRAVETPIAPATFQGRRVGWRELNADQ